MVKKPVTFMIKRQNSQKVRTQMLRLSKRANAVMGKNDPHRRWLQTDILTSMQCLKDVFSMWDCIVNENEKGDIIGLTINADARWDDLELLFSTIARHVENASVVTMEIGDVSNVRIWEFNGVDVESRWIIPQFERTAPEVPSILEESHPTSYLY